MTFALKLSIGQTEDRFSLDPQAFLNADRSAHESNMELVGVWHSNPNQPAKPTFTDHEFAWQGWSYLIFSVGPKEVRDVRSWRFEGWDFVEEMIQS